MHSLLLWLTQLLMQYGYPALFMLLVLGIVGLPVPDETLLTFCGYLIYSGRLQFAPAFVAGFCGTAAGITISYFLGERFGRTVVDRVGKYFLLTPDRLLRTEELFLRYGPPLVMVGYFIPGVRHFTAVAAGMAKLPFPKFALFAYTGAALWVATFLALGYIVGNSWQHSSEVARRCVLAALAAAVLILLVFGSFVFGAPPVVPHGRNGCLHKFSEISPRSAGSHFSTLRKCGLLHDNILHPGRKPHSPSLFQRPKRYCSGV